MTHASIARYRDNQVQAGSRMEILLALHSAAIRSVAAAIDAVDRCQPSRKGLFVGKALSILAELDSTLNPNVAPELCSNLSRLYVYMQARLLQSSIHCDTAMAREVLGLLTNLREAWMHAEADGVS